MDGIDQASTNFSKHKLFLILGLLIILVVGAYLVFINKARGYEIRGSIIEKKEDSIVVKGAIKRSNQKASEEKEISTEIALSPETKYINKTLIIPENYQDGPFTPEEEERKGSQADLVPGQPVSIIAEGNLTKNLTAKIVQYNSIQR